jgi:hypothetical protein
MILLCDELILLLLKELDNPSLIRCRKTCRLLYKISLDHTLSDMGEIHEAIARGYVLIIISGPSCSGKTTIARQLARPYQIAHATLPDIIQYHNSRGIEMYYNVPNNEYYYIVNWYARPEDIVVIDVDDMGAFIPDKLIRLSKLPQYFSQSKKIIPRSIIVIISQENYDKCRSYMEPHYHIQTKVQLKTRLCHIKYSFNLV